MAVRFGQFLVSSGIISQRTLSRAIGQQLNQQEPLGKLAVRAGVLTMKQVLEVLGAQDEDPDCPRFGATAIELGYMSEPDLERLLQRQRETRPNLGSVLIEMQELSYDQIAAAVETFNQQRNPSALDSAGR